MTQYAIGLGSNLGDRLGNLRNGLAGISTAGQVTGLSALYQTIPVGGPKQDPYLNAVVILETELGHGELLSLLQTIELDAGRERKVRWGARTLDLDILVADTGRFETTDLVVPHPRATEREFVLRPLVDVWPDAVVDNTGLEASSALSQIDGQGVERLLTGWLVDGARWHGPALVAGQFFIVLLAALGLAFDGSLPDGEVSAFRVIGVALAGIGAFLAFVSSRRLGAGLTPNPMPKIGAKLVTTGPFRLARHPIYGGVSLFMIGTALILDSVAGFLGAALLIPYFLVKASYEERHLKVVHPGYAEYMSVVTRRLIPFVL